MWAAGLKLPTQASDRQAVCFCGGATAAWSDSTEKQAGTTRKDGQAADGSHEALETDGWWWGVCHPFEGEANQGIVEDVE